MRLKDQVALVTGAASGIGRATAHRFASEGATVGVADVSEEALAAVVAEIAAEGGHAVPVPTDVSSATSVSSAVTTFVSSLGRLDALVNCAGINRDGFAKTLTEQAWDEVLDVNLKGTFLMCQAAFGPMSEQRSGRIANTASIAVRGNFGQANYAASKAGIIGLTRSLALEGARYGINVNCVSPGPTLTPMAAAVPEKIKEAMIARVPLKRMAEPSEIAAMFLFLVSEDASFVTGQHIFCDGGISIGVIL